MINNKKVFQDLLDAFKEHSQGHALLLCALLKSHSDLMIHDYEDEIAKLKLKIIQLEKELVFKDC